MSRIYKIQVRHAGPKSSHDSIELFLIADSEEEVYQWIDKEKNYGAWNEASEEGEMCEILDSDYNVIGEESYKDKMIRLGGDFNDEDADYDDAYYGLTFYGWEDLSCNDIESAAEETVSQDLCPNYLQVLLCLRLY